MISRDRFLDIEYFLHMSDPAEEFDKSDHRHLPIQKV